MIIPKVSTDQQGFSGTFTHMDEMMKNQRERQKKTITSARHGLDVTKVQD